MSLDPRTIIEVCHDWRQQGGPLAAAMDLFRLTRNTEQHVVNSSFPQVQVYGWNGQEPVPQRFGRAEYEWGGPYQAMHQLGRLFHSQNAAGRMEARPIEMIEDGRAIPLVLMAPKGEKLHQVKNFHAEWMTPEDAPGFGHSRAQVWLPFARHDVPPTTALLHRPTALGRQVAGRLIAQCVSLYRRAPAL